MLEFHANPMSAIAGMGFAFGYSGSTTDVSGAWPLPQPACWAGGGACYCSCSKGFTGEVLAAGAPSRSKRFELSKNCHCQPSLPREGAA